MLVLQPLRLLCRISQYTLAGVAEREVNSGREWLPLLHTRNQLIANCFYGGMRSENAIIQSFVFTQQAKQQMLRLDKWRAKLAGFIAREKHNAPRLLCISLEHNYFGFEAAQFYRSVARLTGRM